MRRFILMRNPARWFKSPGHNFIRMNMNVKEAMGTPYVTVRDTDSVLTGLKRLVKEGISGAPVVSADSQLMGMVTEFDLLLAIDHVGEDFPISRLMQTRVISVRMCQELYAFAGIRQKPSGRSVRSSTRGKNCGCPILNLRPAGSSKSPHSQ